MAYGNGRSTDVINEVRQSNLGQTTQRNVETGWTSTATDGLLSLHHRSSKLFLSGSTIHHPPNSPFLHIIHDIPSTGFCSGNPTEMPLRSLSDDRIHSQNLAGVGRKLNT